MDNPFRIRNLIKTPYIPVPYPRNTGPLSMLVLEEIPVKPVYARITHFSLPVHPRTVVMWARIPYRTV